MVFRYTEGMKRNDQRNVMVYKGVNTVPQEPSVTIMAGCLGEMFGAAYSSLYSPGLFDMGDLRGPFIKSFLLP